MRAISFSCAAQDLPLRHARTLADGNCQSTRSCHLGCLIASHGGACVLHRSSWLEFLALCQEHSSDVDPWARDIQSIATPDDWGAVPHPDLYRPGLTGPVEARQGPVEMRYTAMDKRQRGTEAPEGTEAPGSGALCRLRSG